MKLTDEQQLVIDSLFSADSNNKVISVNAVAGSGKTATSNAIVEAVKPTKGFYTAFNRAIVEDSAKRFGTLIEARTLHSLAYKYVFHTKIIEEFTYHNITEDLPYIVKRYIIDTLDGFYRSSYLNLDEFLERHLVEGPFKNEVYKCVCKYANKMLEGKLSSSFNFLLKSFHILLSEGKLETDLDLFILDECQDTTPVTLEILKLLDAKKKVILGDKYQNIYGFMNTVNAFNLLDNTLELNLTTSFRCNDEVAKAVEKYGKKYLDGKFKYSSGVPSYNYTENIVYLARTNNTLIKRMMALVDSNQAFYTARSISEIFELPLTLEKASRGEIITDRKYRYIDNERYNFKKIKDTYSNKDFLRYLSDKTLDVNIISAVKLLEELKNQNIDIYKLKETLSRIKRDKSIILSTAHSFKGLEADTAYIEDDLYESITEVPKGSDDIPEEEYNLYYVALSRARSAIKNNNI